jgi:hypothetical protein
MFKKAVILALIFVMAASTIGCYTCIHRVGNGAQGNNVQKAGQWYALWGLVPINTVDTNVMAAGATDYTIKTQHTFLDLIISAITGYVTIHKKTVYVTK